MLCKDNNYYLQFYILEIYVEFIAELMSFKLYFNYRKT